MAFKRSAVRSRYSPQPDPQMRVFYYLKGMVSNMEKARKEFKAFLEDQIVIFDGAMGTEIYSRGVFINRCYDELNLINPNLIRSIHSSYVRAGAHVIETNTFGANRLKLKQYGLEDKTAEINRRGAELARE